MSITENRQYFLNGNSVLKEDYPEINNAKTILDSNMNYPTQNFDNTLNNPMNYSNGNATFPKTFNKTENFDNMDIDKKNQTMTGFGVNRSEQNFQMTSQNIKMLEIEVEKLYDYYYMFKGYFQNNPSELFNFYLDFKNRYNKGIRVPKRIQGLMIYREEDVDICIRNYLINVRNRFKNNSEYGSTDYNSRYKRSVSAMKGYNSNIKNEHNVRFTKDTLKRLYPKQEEIDKKNEEKLNCDDDFIKFFQKLLKYYKKKNGRCTNDKDEIINFWKNIENKEDKKMEWENGETDFIENIELFFNDEEIITRMSNIYYHYNKMRTYHPTILHNYWEHNLSNENRYLNGLNKYNKDDFFSLLEKNYKQMNSEKNQNFDYQEEEKRKQLKREQMEYKKYINETREEREKKIEELAKPKDKYKTGKVMINLKDQFKYDNIIKKMIKNEFKDNKLFKFPEEYAIRDEDEQKDILFKLGLNRWEPNKKSPDEKIEEQVKEAYDVYKEKKSKMDSKREKRAKLKKDLYEYIEKKVKEYYNNMNKRLSKDENGIESINLFLNKMYKEMSQKYKTATRLFFKRPRHELLKKAYRDKRNYTFYPKKLKYYFFRLLRHLGRDNEGNLKIAKKDNCHFWSPSLSNNCKVHGNNCPIYCCHNTHNDMIKESREKNFNTNFNIGKNKKKLKDSETLNLWKRPDLMKQKEQIFMCFDDARHCTFEPKLSKNIEDEDKIIQSRINNKKWIEEMGPLFTATRATIYKEGILKVAKIQFSKGEYDETLKTLEKGFNIDEILKYKDDANNKIKKYEKPKEEEEKKEDNINNNNNINIGKIESRVMNKQNDKDKYIPNENFTSDKNKQLIEEVYLMYKTIREYIKKQNSKIKKLNEEIKLYKEENALTNNKEKVSTKKIKDTPQEKKEEIQKKYLNIKSHMCPMRDSCPYYLNGKSDECPNGAHQIYELKFKSQVKENIKLQKQLLSNLEKNPEPKIGKIWVPSGGLHTCKCAEGLEGKCHCGFCQYRAKNHSKTNEIMKNRNVEKNRKLAENYEKRKKKLEEQYNKRNKK